MNNTPDLGVSSILEVSEPPVDQIDQNIEFVEAPLSELDQGYALYQENGGSLPKARYEEFLSIREALQEENGKPYEKNRALFMADHAGLELTPEEVFSYRYFRRMMRNGKEDGSQNPQQPSQRDVCGLSDQALLAETLLMEGKLDAYKQFVDSYPYVFKNGEQGALTHPNASAS